MCAHPAELAGGNTEIQKHSVVVFSSPVILLRFSVLSNLDEHVVTSIYRFSNLSLFHIRTATDCFHF